MMKPKHFYTVLIVFFAMLLDTASIFTDFEHYVFANKRRTTVIIITISIIIARMSTVTQVKNIQQQQQTVTIINTTIILTRTMDSDVDNMIEFNMMIVISFIIQNNRKLITII